MVGNGLFFWMRADKDAALLQRRRNAFRSGFEPLLFGFPSTLEGNAHEMGYAAAGRRTQERFFAGALRMLDMAQV